MMKPNLGTIVTVGASVALLVACAGGAGDASSPLRASGATRRVFTPATTVGQAGDGQANEGEVEVCKIGTDGSFLVALAGGGTSTVSITAGTCKVVALAAATDGTAQDVTVTEVANATQYTLQSVLETVIGFIPNTQIDQYVVGPDAPVCDGVTISVNAFHGGRLVYTNRPVAPPGVCDFITFGRLVTSLNGNKVVVSGNIGGNQPGGGVLSEFHVEANGVDNHVANVATYGPISSGPLSLLTNSRISTGIAKNGVAVEVRMWDGGEPGKGTDIVYVKLDGVEILGPNGQYLDQGNMQYHSNCRGPG
jgi:hypothetical protein